MMFSLFRVLTMMTLMALISSPGFAGDHGGNGDSDEINKRALAQLLEGDAYYLKTSKINYLETLNIDQIPVKGPTDVATKNFFKRVGKDALKTDILASRYVTSKDCVEKYKPTVTARTGFGDQGGQVCFDLDKFYKQNINLTTV